MFNGRNWDIVLWLWFGKRSLQRIKELNGEEIALAPACIYLESSKRHTYSGRCGFTKVCHSLEIAIIIFIGQAVRGATDDCHLLVYIERCDPLHGERYAGMLIGFWAVVCC